MVLSPSERVNLIRDVAIRLANEEWPLIDLTLEQFSLPQSEEWNGSKGAYVVAMIQKASDASLLDLALHVGLDFGKPVVGIDPPFWRKGMFRLFVSHLASERVFAGDLQKCLLDYGISGFVAHNDIEPTKEWQTQIETALATCDSLVALLHPGFHKSKWTDQEIGFAMGRGLAVFAVRLGEDPYGFIGRFQAFNGLNKSAAHVTKRLFDGYVKHKETQDRMAEVLVALFEQSTSFAHAKTRIGYLEDVESWRPTFSKRLKAAAMSNSQIKDSFGVPERVAALQKKWE